MRRRSVLRLSVGLLAPAAPASAQPSTDSMRAAGRLAVAHAQAGRWPEAEATLTEAVRLWGLGQRAYRGAALEFFDPDHIGGIMSAALAS